MALPQVDDATLASLPTKQREQVARALRELAWWKENNPLGLYRPHPKQEIFHAFTARNKVFLGGNQSGKTTAGVADDLIQALDADHLPKHLKPYKKFEPPFSCRIFAPKLAVVETVLHPKIKELVPTFALAGGSWANAYDSQLRILRFLNGSEFAFFSYDQDPEAWGGATVNRNHFDEEPTRRAWGESKIRVLRHGGDQLFTMTPTEGLTWTYTEWQDLVEIAEAEEVAQNDSYQLVLVDMDDNPVLTEENKAEALRGLTHEEKQARKSGKFVALHGQIYADFDRDVHRVPERPLPEHINVVVGIDPGIRHACAVVWAYLTPDDTMVVFEEGYYQGMTIKAVCEEIHRVNARYEVEPIYSVIDPSARNKNNQTGRSDQMEFADHGIVTIAGQNAVTAGINRVKERLQTNRLFVQANCPHLINEFRDYRWRKPPQTEDEGREVPVKKDDHLLDALRYLVMSRPYLPEVPDEHHETELQRMMREDRESPAESVGDMGGLLTY